MNPDEQIPPEIQPIFDNTMKEIGVAVASLKSSLSGLTNAHHDQITAELNKKIGNKRINAPQSLPWFKYGLRGFLGNLWYGNHPDNPAFAYHNNANECLSLEDYTDISNKLEIACNTLFYEAADAWGEEPEWMKAKKANADANQQTDEELEKDALAKTAKATPAQPTPAVTPEPVAELALADKISKMMDDFNYTIASIVTKNMNDAIKLAKELEAKKREAENNSVRGRAKAGRGSGGRFAKKAIDDPSMEHVEVLKGQSAAMKLEYYKIMLKCN